MSDNKHKIALTASTLFVSLSTIYLSTIFKNNKRSVRDEVTEIEEVTEKEVIEEEVIEEEVSISKLTNEELININQDLKLKIRKIKTINNLKDMELKALKLHNNRLIESFLKIDNRNLKKLNYLLSKSNLFNFIWCLYKYENTN